MRSQIGHRPSQTDWFALAALCLAWLGVWGAWIPHKTASLTQNAIDLAEWSAILNDVRFGSLAGMPDRLRLAIALAAVALAVAAGLLENRWLRGALRTVAVLPGFVLLPPYPFGLQLWRSELYGTRFIVAMVLWVGVAASGLTGHLAWSVRRALVMAFAAAAAGLSAWAFLALRLPFQAHYDSPLMPGWGVIAFVGGLCATVVLSSFPFLRAGADAPAPA